ncbi:MAG: S46 family peptidase [Bacteroidales bacterium]|nr:S46 family peptidase [Bacteroidales bacterium]MBN2697785.1 S46 family peptidase [Bacteroidales bacterium]
MKIRLRFLQCTFIISLFNPVAAEEGMWIPLMMDEHIINEMQFMGCKLSAEEIFSLNQDCLADAVVIFGNGCTGEVISPEGLVLTNHHCGFRSIQSVSSVEHDYISNGYWAMSKEEELPIEGLTVTFLRHMENVTDRISGGLDPAMDDEERNRVIQKKILEVAGEISDENGSRAVVKPFFYGNEYYLFVYDVFRDIRLAGAPPNSIGNFGTEEDNWVWPRHTGDFAIFRIYAGKDNSPADYSPENIPYKPEKYFEISLAGLEEGDFAMVLGYPGRTEQYLYSGAIKTMVEISFPHAVNLRTIRLNIMKSYMKASDRVRIQYASKYDGISNYWKKWQGMIRGLDRIDAIDLKREKEEEFLRWMKADDIRILKYDWIMPEFRKLYAELDSFALVMEYLDEAAGGIELCNQMRTLSGMMSRGESVEHIAAQMETFYRNFYNPVDRNIFAAMMQAFHTEVPPEFHPDFLRAIYKKYRGDFSRCAEKIYKQSWLSEPEKAFRLLDVYGSDQAKGMKLLTGDPIFKCVDGFSQMFNKRISPEKNLLDQRLEKVYRAYLSALREMVPGHELFPDANFTMRFSYGKVEGFSPSDAVRYDYFTTMTGIMEKNATGEDYYAIGEKLKALYSSRDFGPYGIDGTMPVCFINSTHTTNGNSGSPVLDAEGRLIGIGFDRNWEGTISDVMYDRSICRNITADIRYVLFIIDKFAGAGHLLEEMDIIYK